MTTAIKNSKSVCATPLASDLVVHYRHGWCTHLALSLHRLTKHPLAVLVREGDDGMALAHAVLEIDGRALDAAGFASFHETTEYYMTYWQRDSDDQWKWHYFDNEEDYKEFLKQCFVVIDEDGYEIHKSINVAKTLATKLINS